MITCGRWRFVPARLPLSMHPAGFAGATRRRIRPRSFARATGGVSGSAFVRPPGSRRSSLRPDHGVVRCDSALHPGRYRLRSHRRCGLDSLPCDGAYSRACMRRNQGAETRVRPALTGVVRGPQRIQEMHRGHGNGIHASVPFPGHARAATSRIRAGTHPCFRRGRGPNMALRYLTSIGLRHAVSVAPFPVSACKSRGRCERTRAESDQREHHDPTPPRASRGVLLRPAVDRRASLCALHRGFSPSSSRSSHLDRGTERLESASFRALSGW